MEVIPYSSGAIFIWTITVITLIIVCILAAIVALYAGYHPANYARRTSWFWWLLGSVVAVAVFVLVVLLVGS